MAGELWRALCLVAVFEGLVLFVSPNGWKRAAEQLRSLPDPHLRVVGGIVVAMALTGLWCLRQG